MSVKQRGNRKSKKGNLMKRNGENIALGRDTNSSGTLNFVSCNISVMWISKTHVFRLSRTEISCSPEKAFAYSFAFTSSISGKLFERNLKDEDQRARKIHSEKIQAHFVERHNYNHWKQLQLLDTINTKQHWFETMSVILLLRFNIVLPEYSKFLHDETENEKLVQKLREENIALKEKLLEKDTLINEKDRVFKTEKIRSLNEKQLLENEILKWKEKYQAMEEKYRANEEKYQAIKNDYDDMLLEVGRLSVENDSKANKVQELGKFWQIFSPASTQSLVVNTEGTKSLPFSPKSIISSNAHAVNSNSSQSNVKTNLSPALTLPSQSREQVAGAGAQVPIFNPLPDAQYQISPNQNSLSATNENNVSFENVPFSVQADERSNFGPISLAKKPSCSIAVQVYNAYKLLLLTISNWLLSSDIIKLKEWANEKFAVERNLSVTATFSQLDQKGAINALDLGQLRAFFVSILRCDLVYLIDEFSAGDYDKFKRLISQHGRRQNSHETARTWTGSEIRGASYRVNVPQSSSSSWATTAGQGANNVEQGERLTRNDETHEIPIARNNRRLTNIGSNLPSTSNSNAADRSPASGSSATVSDASVIHNTRGNASDERRVSGCGNTPIRAANMKGRKSPSRQNSVTQGSSGPSQHRSCDNNVQRSDHRKKQDKWLCNHYKRKCVVKFECCNKYWPCHRCHNEQSTCGRRKLKSRDTTMIKCVECGKEQQFGQFCVSCNTQFSTFYCGLCKHLTGNDDHPYHCDKCGICRIHGDRSYHCDVCGICLDVQLRGNHKCRPNSAHDECCICLEDAFTGCQILPCSHKVHKDCATKMIRSGITRCPVCRESFAHKLERRSTAK